MEDRKYRRPSKEDWQSLVQESEQAAKEQKEQKDYSEVKPYVKIALIGGTALFVVWGSQFVFHALASAIRGFKDLKRSLKE